MQNPERNMTTSSDNTVNVQMANVVSGGSCETGTIALLSKELRMIRLLLRLLSLWRPRTAGALERYVYPVLINLLLFIFGIFRNTVRATGNTSEHLSIQWLYIVHETCIRLGHILGNVYFRSEDLETNVLPNVQPVTGTRKPLERMLRHLKHAVVASLLFFITMLCTLFVASQMSLRNGKERFSSDFFNVDGPLDYIFYVFVIISIVYNLGVGLALTWTMGLLYVCFASRLNALEEIFLKWKKPTIDAVFFFQQVYARPVRRSWERISWWFLVHNFIVVVIPLYGYELAQAFSGTAYQSRHLPHFICYLVFVLTVWLMPTVVAEQIRRAENMFQENVNNFCPGMLAEMHGVLRNSNSAAVVSRAVEDNVFQNAGYLECFTLASRGEELRAFQSFLEKRAQGLVSRGYVFQLNISLVSLLIGIVSFLIKFRD